MPKDAGEFVFGDLLSITFLLPVLLAIAAEFTLRKAQANGTQASHYVLWLGSVTIGTAALVTSIVASRSGGAESGVSTTHTIVVLIFGALWGAFLMRTLVILVQNHRTTTFGHVVSD